MTRRLRIDDELADAILSGNRVNDERLDAVTDFADLVRELGHGPVPAPSAALQSLFASTPPPPPLAAAATRRMATASRPHVARRPRRGVLALVMSVVAVGAFGAAGVAGALPSSVQRRLADVVERLTPFSIPRPTRSNGTTTPDPVGTVTSGVNSPTTAGSSAGRPIARPSARSTARTSARSTARRTRRSTTNATIPREPGRGQPTDPTSSVQPDARLADSPGRDPAVAGATQSTPDGGGLSPDNGEVTPPSARPGDVPAPATTRKPDDSVAIRPTVRAAPTNPSTSSPQPTSPEPTPPQPTSPQPTTPGASRPGSTVPDPTQPVESTRPSATAKPAATTTPARTSPATIPRTSPSDTAPGQVKPDPAPTSTKGNPSDTAPGQVKKTVGTKGNPSDTAPGQV